MKLTNTHIEQIRSYFLSSGEEEQLSMLNSIEPSELSTFLPQLKQVFNSTSESNERLITIAKSMDAEEHLESLQEIQRDYYSHLAQLHIAAISNPDIGILLKTNNADFLNELNFQKELQVAFLLNERANFKRTFLEIEKGSAISSEEINLAFKLEERQKLKQQFQAIENKRRVLKPVSPIIQFNWKRLAIAATLIGAILTTTYYVFDKKNKQPDIASTANNEKRHIAGNLTDRDLMEKKIHEALTSNLTPAGKKIKIEKGISLGFATKDEIISIQVYDLRQDILAIDSIISGDMQEFEAEVTALKIKKDSLENLESKYRFYNDTLLIYHATKDIKPFKLNSSYFIRINGKFYDCKISSKPLTLKLTDKETSRELADMIY